MLNRQAKTELILNTLIYADFSVWSQKPLRELIDYLTETVNTMSAQQNRIMLTYNPILTICLSCINLKSIGKSIAVFSHEVNSLIEQLLTFGEVIISEMDKVVIGPIFMDKDFKERTVLHLITENGYA
jgi:hypothetical protein